MTETLHEPAPPPPDHRRLVRDPDEKVVAGVCAAVGRYTDTDPVLWRVTVAVLTLFGGAGLALYALGWLLVPETGQSSSLAERTLRRPDRGLTAGGIVLLVVGGIVLVALLDNGPALPALLVVGGIAYLVSRERREHPVPPQPPLANVPYGPAPEWLADPTAPTAPAPPRERSPLGALTVSTAAVVAGLLLALRAAVGGTTITTPRIIAVALVVVGTGLVVGTWFGRARWLIAVGLALAVALAATSAAERYDVEHGVGERTWLPTAGAGEYRLGAGEATLDLRGLPPGEPADLTARIGVGHLIVLVPDGTTVRVDSRVKLGEISVAGTTLDDGGDLRESFVVGTGTPTVTLDLQVQLGEIEVRRVSS